MTAFLFVLSMGYVQSELFPDLPNEIAHDWYGISTWVIIGIVALFGLWVWGDRRTTRQRLGDLESDVSQLKDALTAERNEHGTTQRILAETQQLLASALRHIRELWEWCQGGHVSKRPDAPNDLKAKLDE